MKITKHLAYSIIVIYKLKVDDYSSPSWETKAKSTIRSTVTLLVSFVLCTQNAAVAEGCERFIEKQSASENAHLVYFVLWKFHREIPLPRNATVIFHGLTHIVLHCNLHKEWSEASQNVLCVLLVRAPITLPFGIQDAHFTNKLLTKARNKIVKIFEEQGLFVSLKPFFPHRVH